MHKPRRMCNRARLLQATFLLVLAALNVGFAIDSLASVPLLEDAELWGAGCAVAALLAAIRPKGRWSAALIVLFVSMAIVLAGPAACFLLLFGLLMGVGGLFALVGAGWGTGLEDVALDSLGLLAAGVFMSLVFASQAWAILRAYDAWKNGARQGGEAGRETGLLGKEGE